MCLEFIPTSTNMSKAEKIMTCYASFLCFPQAIISTNCFLGGGNMDFNMNYG